jgi:Na+/H+-dicarboxylate symporter
MIFKRLKDSLSLQIILAITLGLIAGPVLGPTAAPLGELGKLYIQLIKTVAAPLVFFAIVEALVRNEIRGRSAGRLVFITSINATIAACIGLILSNVFQPGKKLHIEELEAARNVPTFITEKFSFVEALSGYVPHHILQPFVENNILLIVVFAVVLGCLLRYLRNPAHAMSSEIVRGASQLEDLCSAAFKIFELILEWVVKLTPYAVFGVVARTIGEFGWSPLHGLAWYVGVGLLGLSLQPLVTYQIWLHFFNRFSLRDFWSAAKAPIVYGIGANSSLATLPLTLKALDRLKISKASSRLGACVGTNLNNDGILLYEAMAVIFVAQFHGIDLSLTDQAFAMITCVIAAIGIAGVPDAGIVSLSLVLTTVGLPLEVLPLLLTADWILARGRTVVNVLSDMTVSVTLDEFERRGRDKGV